MMDQAIARAVRFGQTEVVQVFHLLIKTELGRNIDTFTADIAEGKRCLLEAFFEMAGGAREEEDDDGPVPEPEAHAGPDPEVPLTRMEALAVLGVTNGSDQEAIGKAYRTLVLKWHPDKNIGNEVAATVKFRRIQEAYELLTA
jgi:DnaJ-domain-containing protein 1